MEMPVIDSNLASDLESQLDWTFMENLRTERVWARLGFSMAILLTLASCSSHVSPEKVAGNYAASYPFGSAHLTLRHNGTFVQTVSLNGHQPATVNGTWSFDATNSKITLRGMMAVVDGFGNLERDWKAITDYDEIPVEVLWLKTEIEVNESYGYVKE